jgi:LAO/AO transport system kinase
MIDSGELIENRKRQNRQWMWSLLEEGLKESFIKNQHVKNRLHGLIREIDTGNITPSAAARELLSLFKS